MASSRDWVCIRAATYEDAGEAAFLREAYTSGVDELRSIYNVLSGRLENTTFGLYAPDGETQLSCVTRGPTLALDTLRVKGVAAGGSGETPQRFASALRTLAGEYVPSDVPRSLPLGIDLRRAINVAACDNQPLVVVGVEDEEQRSTLEAQLARLAWSAEFVGRLHYVRTTEPEDDEPALASIAGAPSLPAVFVVQPGTFGLDGRVLATCPADATIDELEQLLDAGLGRFDRVELGRDEHVERGLRAGATWEGAVTKRNNRRNVRHRRERAPRDPRCTPETEPPEVDG